MFRRYSITVSFLFTALVAAEIPAQERERPRRQRQRWAQPALEGVKVIRNLAYAEGNKAWVLDLYLPVKKKAEQETAPRLVAWIHGGGWKRGSKNRVPGSFRRLAKEGYAVASIEYRLTGLASHPDQVHDCKGAIRWLRANAEKYGYDASRIGVGGGSAGGHLVLMLGTTGGNEKLEGKVGGNLKFSSRVQAVIDLFGPSDFLKIAKERKNRARTLLSKGEDFVSDLSPVTHVSKDDPPLLILQGDADSLVAPSQSKRIHEVYKKAKLDSTLHMIPGARHGGRRFSDERRYRMIKSFLDAHIRRDQDAGERFERAVEAAEKEAPAADGGENRRRRRGIR